MWITDAAVIDIDIGITSMGTSRNFRRFRETATDFELRGRVHFTEFCETRLTTDNGSNFLKAFRIYGEQDENNNSASDETEDEISDVMCDDVDGVEVDFVEVTAVLDEDDGLQFQLPKHHRCACHLLNLVSAVDAAKACSNEAYKKLSRSAFAKCHALWNKCGRSAAAAEIIEDVCKIQMIRPNTTRCNSLFLAIERVLRIIKDQGDGAIRTVCTSLKLPM